MVEIFLAFLMSLDIFLYSYISKCTINIFVLIEWFVILSYSIVLFIIVFIGID